MAEDLLFKQMTKGGKSTVTLRGSDVDTLVNNVHSYRINAGLGRDYNRTYNDVKRQLRSRKISSMSRRRTGAVKAGKPVKRDITGKQKPSRRRMRLAEITNGALAVVDIVAGGAVSQSEINRRAAICFNCPRCTDVSDCMGCGAAGKITRFAGELQKKVGRGFTMPRGVRKGKRKHETLGKLYCEVCGCSCSTMAVAKMKHFREKEFQNESRPDYCWVKKGGVNYVES